MAETDGTAPPAGTSEEPVNAGEFSAEKVGKHKFKEYLEETEQTEDLTPSESKDTLDEGMVPSEATDTDAPLEAPSFKEESYKVGELKDSERKALDALRLKVDEAIQNRSIFLRKKVLKKEAVSVVETSKEREAEAAKIEELAKIEEAESGEAAPPPNEEGKNVVSERDLGEVATEEVVQASEEEAPEEVPVVDVPKEEPVAVDVPEEKLAAVDVLEEPAAVDVPEEKVSEEPVSGDAPENTGEAASEEATVREVVLEESVPPAPKNFSIWDIPIHDGDERTDVILLKFLRAREFNVNDAFKMLKSTISWRKDFAADSLLNEDLGTEFDSLAYMYGFDRNGHPVCYNQYGAFQDKSLYQKTLGDGSKFNKFLRWRIQVLEKGVQKLEFTPGGVNSMVQVIDLKNSPGLVKRRHISKQVVSLLQDNYPELVAKQIIINAPWYLPAVYAVFGRIFTPRQIRKVELATPEKSAEILFKYIAPEQVPAQYGGLGRPGDTEFEGLEAPVTQVSIKPGEKHALELPVAEPETILVWDISVVGWDVLYGEEFVPSDEKDYTIIVQKTKKLPASTAPLRNAYKASQPGKVVLIIDNSNSQKKKTAVYRFASKKTIPATDS